MSQERTDSIEAKNILREKTFNPELKDLVSKITSHSKGDMDNASLNAQKDKLLVQFHKLFYATYALSESINISEITNLFYTQDNNIGAHSELLSNLLKRYFSFLGCKGYSILVGDYKKKSYSMSDTYYDKIPSQKILIGLYDDILTKINSSDLGYITDSEDLNRFAIQDEFIQNSIIYFIRINFLTNELKRELFHYNNPNSDPNDDNFIYSPILMLIMPKRAVSPTELFKIISKDLAIPLYILAKNIAETIKPLAEDDFRTLINKYEFILQSCCSHRLNNAIILEFDNVKCREDAYIMDYIFSKISFAFQESVKIQTNPSKIIIFFKSEFISKVKNMVNKISEDIDMSIKTSDILIKSDISNKTLLEMFFM